MSATSTSTKPLPYLTVGVAPVWEAPSAPVSSGDHPVDQSGDEVLVERFSGQQHAEPDRPRDHLDQQTGIGGLVDLTTRHGPLDDAEKKKARADLAKYVGSARTLATAQATAMHAKVIELLPPRCWSPSP